MSFGSTDSTCSRRRRTSAGWPSAFVSKPTFYALRQSFHLQPPARIVSVLPSSSVVGACIRSESTSNRCRRITVSRRLRTFYSVVVTNICAPSQLAYISVFVVAWANVGASKRQASTSVGVALTDVLYFGWRIRVGVVVAWASLGASVDEASIQCQHSEPYPRMYPSFVMGPKRRCLAERKTSPASPRFTIFALIVSTQHIWFRQQNEGLSEAVCASLLSSEAFIYRKACRLRLWCVHLLLFLVTQNR